MDKNPSVEACARPSLFKKLHLQLYDKNSLINTEVPRETFLKLTLERDDSPEAFHPYFSSPEKVIEYIQRIGNPCEYPYVTISDKVIVPT